MITLMPWRWSVLEYVRESVRGSVRGSVRESVRESVRGSVRESVRESVFVCEWSRAMLRRGMGICMENGDAEWVYVSNTMQHVVLQ